MKLAFIDIESQSPWNLKTHKKEYIASPYTKILCIVVKMLGGEVTTWERGEDFTKMGLLLNDPSITFAGHNMHGFDGPMIENHFPVIFTHTLDTMDLWRPFINEYKGSRMSLKVIAAQFGLAKDTRGDALIKTMCVPKGGRFYTGEDYQEYTDSFKGSVYAATNAGDRADMLTYCIQDVQVLEDLCRIIPMQIDQKIQELTNKMNKEGIRVDTILLKAAITASQNEKDRVLEKIGHDAKFVAGHDWIRYMKKAGVELENTQDAYLESLLPDIEDEHLQDMIAARRLLSSMAQAKLQGILKNVHPDGRIRNFLVLNGTHTGRNSGKGAQPQNLARGNKVTWATLTYFIAEGIIPFDAIPDMIRASFMPDAPGDLLGAFDKSSIEARLAVWFAGDEEKLQMYRDGVDLYKVMATTIFDKKVEDVTGDERSIAKAVVLSCIYGAGADTLAERIPILPDGYTHIDLINAFRDANPLLAGVRTGAESSEGLAYRSGGLWKELQSAVKNITEGKSEKVECAGGKVIFERHGKDLWMRKPSGLIIYFRNIRFTYKNFDIVKVNKHKPDSQKEVESYFVNDEEVFTDLDHFVTPELLAEMKVANYRESLTYGFACSLSLYGGKLLNSACQGTCGDLMKSDLKRLDRVEGIVVKFDVHDEYVINFNNVLSYTVAEFQAKIDEISACMTHVPSWLKGLPIEIDYNITPRYSKEEMVDTTWKEMLEMNAKLDVADKNYVEGHPTMQDQTYDEMTLKVEDYVGVERDFCTKYEEGDRVTHKFPMKSLKKAYSDKQMIDFTDEATVVEEKLDGMSLMLHYVAGKLREAITRGGGVDGVMVTDRAMVFAPVAISCMREVYIRGEVVVPKCDNPASVASGQMNSGSDTPPVNCSFIAYEVAGNKLLHWHTQVEVLNFLEAQGFDTPQWSVSKSPLEMFELSSPYAKDGAVVKVNNIAKQQVMGSTRHHPKWACARKWQEECEETTITGVEHGVGRLGAITPVANVVTVELNGKKVTKVTLHNLAHVKDLKVGAKISIRLAGGTTPKLEKIIDAGDGVSLYITECPSCGEILVKGKCNNITCHGRELAKMVYFCKTLHIKKYGPVKIQSEGIHTFAELLEVPYVYNSVARCTPVAIAIAIGEYRKSKSYWSEQADDVVREFVLKNGVTIN